MTLKLSVLEAELHRYAFPTPNQGRPKTLTLSIMSAPPAIPPVESSDSFNPDFDNISPPTGDGALGSPVHDAAFPPPDQRTAPQDAQAQQRVHDILHSDIGVSTLLNRLKASITSARVGADTFSMAGRHS
jgi:hypothetical protein